MTPEEMKDMILSHSGGVPVECILSLDKKLDKFFGIGTKNLNTYQFSSTEASFQNREEAYIGLEHAALSTSYVDYYNILTSLGDDKVIVDVGAGFCRGTLLSEFLSLNQCISIELLESRCLPARLFLKENHLNENLVKTQDIESISALPVANAYYFYFHKGKLFYEVLNKIIGSVEGGDTLLYICESHGDVIEFIDSMPSLFNANTQIPVSLPRHNDYIHSYSINGTNSDHFTWKENLNEWYLINHTKNLIIEFEFTHKVLKKTMTRYIPITQLDLVFYIDSWCLEHSPTERILNVNSEFLIKNVVPVSSYSKDFQGLLNSEQMNTSKLLKGEQYFWEDKYGQVFPLQVLE